MLDLVGRTPTSETPAEMIADTGYHSRGGLKALEDSAWKSRISEKERKAFARWHGDDAARRAVYNNLDTSAACAAPGCAAPEPRARRQPCSG